MRKPTAEEVMATYGKIAGGIAREFAWFNPLVRADLHGEANLALLDAAERFDWSRAEHDYQFPAYARLHIKGKLKDWVASTCYALSGPSEAIGDDRALGVRADLERSEHFAAQRSQSYWGTRSTDLDRYDDAVQYLLTNKWTDEERELWDCFAMGLADTEIAEFWPKSRATINRIRHRMTQEVIDEMEAGS